LISNTDDHLRNHAFLRDSPAGWRLAPAYDLNPVPVDVRPRILSTPVSPDGDPSASLELAFEAAPHFGLTAREAGLVAREVAAATSSWREAALSLGIASAEIERS